jgi:glycosyltransferase involved in cell wall biosynthesis
MSERVASGLRAMLASGQRWLRQSRWARQSGRVLGLALVVISTLYVLRNILPWLSAERWRELAAGAPTLALVLALLTACQFLWGFSWHVLLSSLGYRVPIRHCLALQARANLAKYLPGGFWHLAGKAYLTTIQGVPLAAASLALALEVGCSAGIYALVTLVSMPSDIQGLAGVPWPIGVRWGAIALALGAFLVFPYAANAWDRVASRKGLRWARMKVTGSRFWLACLLMTIHSLLTGIALSLVVNSLPALPLRWSYAVYALALSTLIGLVTFVAPGGLGVREAVLTRALAVRLPLGAASFMALLSRIFFVMSELVFFLLTLAIDRIRVGKAREHSLSLAPGPEPPLAVCVVTTAFPRWEGDGQAAFVWEAARAVALRGVRVRVVAMHSPGARSHEFVQGVEIIRPRYAWPEHWEGLRREGAGGLPETWKKHPLLRLQLVPFMVVHILNVMRYARSCDVVHAHWTLSAAAAFLGSWFHRCPLLVTVQGSDIFQVTRHPLGQRVTGALLRRCRQVTALSAALAEATIAAGVPAAAIQVIPNGVDTFFFSPPADAQRDDTILYVGSLIERKGLHYLLRALPQVLQAFPGYRLLLAGEGPQEAILKQAAAQLGIASHVSFLGFQSQEQVRNLLQRARVLALPSVEEGLGVVLLEALACGTPIVASRTGGIPDVVTADVGLLVPPADSPQLAEALTCILADPPRWEGLSRCARQRAISHYDWNSIAGQFVDLYRTLART